MNMESPVRIFIGVALVVNLLLLSSTLVSGNALPHETTSTTVKNEKNTRHEKINGTTWNPRNNIKSPDTSLNELSPKESPTEEHTEKNAKYKHRGRIRYQTQLKTTTETPLRRVRSSTKPTNIIIVTPTPEVKKPAQIIDSMKKYKRTKLPVIISSTPSTSLSAKTETHSEEEEYDEEDEEDKEFERITSGKFDNNFFTIPNYNDDFSHFTDHKSSDNQVRENYKTSPFGFSTFFPKDSYDSKEDNHESYNSDSFFDFELTTPKNDFFDKKYQEISEGILKRLSSIPTHKPTNATNVHKIVKENIGLERVNNNTPTNKSTVIIKNTKEIRLLDNESAGTANSGISDVQGTSIYYEMSVLSTETYAINHSDDDCDNDTLPLDPTMSSSSEEQIASIKATQATLLPGSTKPTYPDPKPSHPDPSSESISTLFTNYLPISSINPSVYNSVSSTPVSVQNNVYSISSTEKPTKAFSSSYNRNRSYPKRLNFNGTRDSPNSVTSKSESASQRSQTRKFYHTTPKTKAIWMLPRRNITKINTRPATIYSEHFNIKDKYSTTHRPKQPNKTILTTVSSEIDPVLQSDISGIEKVVHSPSISDNSIPSLWKRGSTKFATSTATPAETGDINDMEIPPTLTAWALASLRSPPSLPSSSINATGSTQKSIDENELQKVGEVTDKKEGKNTTPTSTTTTKLNNDIETKKIVEVDQNKLGWKPVFIPASTDQPTNHAKTELLLTSERLPAESNLYVKSSAQPSIPTESISLKPTEMVTEPLKNDSKKWVSVTEHSDTTPAILGESIKTEAVPISSTNLTGFESITKLPSDLTTPQDEIVSNVQENQSSVSEIITKLPTTTDYEITTIRFSYVPTEEVMNTTEMNITQKPSTSTDWHPVFPTRTRLTTINDGPVTTYRPQYMTTTDYNEETTTDVTEIISVSSEDSHETESEKLPDVTEMIKQTTTQTATKTTITTTTEESTTEPISTPNLIPLETTTSDNVKTTVAPETTSIVTEIVTEINTEMQQKSTTEAPTTIVTEEATATSSSETDCTSEEDNNSNEVITQDSSESTTTARTTTISTGIQTQIQDIDEKLITTESGITTTEVNIVNTQELTTQRDIETTTQRNAKIYDTTVTNEDTTIELTTDFGTKSVNDLEDVSSYNGEMTTEARPRVSGEGEEESSGAAVAIAVSTIGVIALILLIGLLLIVRRRGRRGVYAQRCTPVSLDAYSLDSVSVGHRKGNHRLRASKRSYGNPAYDDEVTSHPMNYAALANFALDVDSIIAEFSEIPSVTVRPDEVPPGCEDKNRYSNVLPLPETRVPLKRIGNDPTTEYINANYITGPGNIRNYYIACQAPLSNTVVDFWRMIWEQNSRLIVMLTEYMENGVEKCYEYLPPSEVSDNKRTFGDYQIILKKREQRDKYAISSVQLINLATRTWREVTHLWYFWPAKGVPDDYDSVIDFLSEMRSYMKISQTAKEYDEEGVEVIYGDQNRSSFSNLSKLRSEDSSSGNGLNVYSPAKAEEQLRRGNVTNGTLSRMKAASEVESVRACVAVCASGAGRAAALLAADVCARALAAGACDVPRVVRELRAQRPHSLTNRHHYIFLYKLLSEYGNKLMGGGVDTI
ncbi:receptor-type tyrosine-protein phosphatase zeta-like [Galleria mellonella]|uniref:Receptor-type tyrosine-protein phosphatase zeta-like n=1 Tax=Galleria mellonella TaxID=7137 RepID=A0ABM3MLH3_GALME|nr:receptor-type tyrosine-protein phosphatase zeta-like [Galleria mellonella]XP_052752217.1 receptor-type tyrosine-protein phosphatase zeta-like [Galleria mellonella]XP_052752218.1 receptor-type tyrosine-protein phosphatase zeta-like [Galleria mellonella]XP_052752219.1 receptor-type tyrosine-protein phosphatase zeta-like [Galleria mellonella]XP_052752220.1 receptor-type tyrosine-protein phosphatase zeta-like [Galleria mellonella]XP_052752221.1 receptor-type tyrosine-protein phosphatase zeta-li